jgi:hypothetical protein
LLFSHLGVALGSSLRRCSFKGGSKSHCKADAKDAPQRPH